MELEEEEGALALQINLVTHTAAGTTTAASKGGQFLTTLGGLIGNVLEW
jgi:hypothetical protein